MPELIKAILLGIVEGVTEFLPVSSTGHLLLCEKWFGLSRNPQFWRMFVVFIQIGAIAAVVVYFRERILELLRGSRPERKLTPLEISAHISPAVAEALAPSPLTATTITSTGASVPAAAPVVPVTATDDVPPTAAQRGYAILMIALASVPLVIAYFAEKWSERHMGSPIVIAVTLIVGGLLMLVIEFLPLNVTTRRIENITWKQALGIGMAQVLAAVFPGTSRSAATIMGGLVAGLSRPAAAEFSFFLAIPAMFGACSYKLFKYVRAAPRVDADDVLLLAIVTMVSFLVAWAVIAAFMAYIRRHSFAPFAVYRIVFGIAVLLLMRGYTAPQVVDATDVSAAAPTP